MACSPETRFSKLSPTSACVGASRQGTGPHGGLSKDRFAWKKELKTLLGPELGEETEPLRTGTLQARGVNFLVHSPRVCPGRPDTACPQLCYLPRVLWLPGLGHGGHL